MKSLAPRIISVLLNSSNGNLSVSWELLHTGGSDLESITVLCSGKGNDDHISSGISYPLTVMLECSVVTMNYCMLGNISIGPVISGVNYSCSVAAENGIGRDELRSKYVLTTTG